MTGWPSRFDAVAALDDEEWDAEHQRLSDEWRAAYSAAFLDAAVDRGWSREDAETWLPELIADAFLCAPEHDYDPVRCAAADVILCEEPL